MVTKYQVKDILKTDKQKIDKDLENIQRFIAQPGLIISEDTLGIINDQVKAMKDYSKALGNLIEDINTSGYTKAEVKGKVIVKYLDTDSKEIDKQDIITGEIGADYSVTAKSISGYTLKTDATNKKGKFTEDDITVTFTYTKDIVKVTGVTIAPDSVSVAVGATTQLSGSVTPSNATNKKITYTSSDETIATVDETGKVTGKKVGEADITGTSEDGAKTAKSKITVTEA